MLTPFLLILLPVNANWLASLQNSYSTPNSAFLGRISTNGGLESLNIKNAESDYPSDSLVYASGVLYFTTRKVYSEMNTTMYLKKGMINNEAITLFSLETRQNTPNIQHLISNNQFLFFSYGYMNGGNVGRLDMRTDEIITIFNGTGDFMKNIQGIMVDSTQSKIIIAQSNRMITINYDGGDERVIGDFTYYGLLLDGNRFIWWQNPVIFYKNIIDVNSTFYATEQSGDSSKNKVLFNLTGTDAARLQDGRAFIDRDMIIIHTELDIFTLPLRGGSSSELRKIITLNGTTSFKNLTRIYTMIPAGGSLQPLDVSIAITVVLALTTAAVVASNVAGGSASTTVTPPTSAVTAPDLSQILQEPSGILWIIISQLQILVILSQVQGEINTTYLKFTSGISWLMLVFRDATYGIQTKASATSSRFAESLGMDASQLFGSVMISILIITSSVGVIYGGLWFVLRRRVRTESVVMIKKGGGNEVEVAKTVQVEGDVEVDKKQKKEIKTEASIKEVAVEEKVGEEKKNNEKPLPLQPTPSLLMDKIQFLHQKIPKYMIQFFLLTYLTLCTNSVLQLQIPDPVGGLFAGLTLILICTFFWIYLLVVLTKDYSIPPSLQPLHTTLNNILYPSFIMIKEPIVDKYQPSLSISAFVSIFIKYLIGLTVGITSAHPLPQTIILLLILIVEFGYTLKFLPLKFRILSYIEIVCCGVRVICMALRIGMIYDQSEGLALAVIILNAILIFFILLGLLIGIVIGRVVASGKKGEEGEVKVVEK